MSGPIKTHIKQNAATYDLWRVAETSEIGQLVQLLARGADVNASNDLGVTALMIAASHGRFEMVRALTDHGADVNATDSDGLTAAMMANSARREDIVSLLVARGARGIPKRHSSETSPTLTRHQTPVGLPVSKAAEKRNLAGPPNIWDVVHETHVEFDPRSAFFGHLRSINPHVYALVALIVGGGALLGFVWLRGWSGSAPAVKTESDNSQMVQSSPASAPDTTAASSDQQSGSQTTEPVTAESPSSQPSPMTPTTARLAGAAANAKTATPREPAKRVAAKPSQTGQAVPTPVGGETVTSTGNLDNPDKSKTPSTPAPGSDNKKSVEPIFENKNSVKVPSPAPTLPAKVRPTPDR
jgi:hypothetical protein